MATRRIARRGTAADPEDYRDEEETPRRTSRRAPARDEDEEDETPRSRRAPRRDDEDVDDEPTPPRRASKKGTGFAGAKKAAEQHAKSAFSNDLKFGPGISHIIKLLEDEPFDHYSEHWLKKEGQKSYTCTDEDDCPLCEIGAPVSVRSLWNVVKVSDDGEPELFLMKLPPTATDQLEGYASNKKTSPLSAHYWEVERKGEFGKSRIAFEWNLIKERDLEEDCNIVPLTDKELAFFEKKKYTSDSAIPVSTKRDLKEVAAEVLGDD